VRIYFAGGGFDNITEAIGHPWKLNSFLEVGPKMGREIALKSPESTIIDSGLFSFMFGTKKGQIPPTFEAYRDYTRRYIDTLDAYGYRGILVECDTHKLLGMDATFRLREEFAPLGDRVIYTWHAPETLEGLIKLAKEKSYIALSVPELRILAGGTAKTGNTTNVLKLLQYLRRHVPAAQWPRIHLLGCTVPTLMETNLAWSCDSTSWIATTMYGVGFVYEGSGRLKRYDYRGPEFAKWCAQVNARFGFGEPGPKRDRVTYNQMLATGVAFADYQRWLDTKFSPLPVKEYRL